MKARRFFVLILIVVLSVGLTLLAEAWGGLTGVQTLSLQTLDFRQRATAEDLRQDYAEEPGDIVLVFFDEEAVAEWPYLSPFPRRHLADLVGAVSGAGARTIGLDVYLDRRMPTDPEADEALRRAMAEAGNVVVVGPTLVTDSGPRLVPPHPYFAEVAADVGAADMPNPFETARNAALAVRSGKGLEPGFALALYAHYRGMNVDSLLRVSRSRGRIELPGMPDGVGRIPKSWWEEGQRDEDFALTIPIRYVGPPSNLYPSERAEIGTFTALSSSTAAFLAMAFPETFRDRVVLLGSGFHDSDKFRTPFSNFAEASSGGDEDLYEWTFGVEVHANLLQNMLEGRYLQTLDFDTKVLFLATAAFLAGLATFLTGAGWGGLATLVVALGSVAVAFWAWTGEVFLFPGDPILQLDQRFLWTPLVTTVLAAASSYVASVGYVAVVEGQEKRFIKGAFGKYVSPDVVDRIADHPDALRLGGQKRPLSILFSDLAGFTTLSERMEPEELIATLNEYLTVMTRLVMDEAGTLDKYIGDAIMAFWNAPAETPDHPDRALRCAIVMQRKMNELNEKWLTEDPEAEPLVVRIGVNTGEVVVGNVGGENRFDYSAIGDAVNLAARLEPANKTYDTLVMASQYTLDAADASAFRVRELDLLAVKGKREPVTVYEVLEEAGVELAAHREEALAHYASGLRAYKNRDWELAARYFEAALEADPSDGPSRLYLDRCQEYMESPPPADWDFVVRRTVK